jgi:hypothetical protein
VKHVLQPRSDSFFYDTCRPALQDAHTAFQAVASAAKVLQDSGLRGALDAEREDRELRLKAQQAAAVQARAAAWNAVRGGGQPVPGFEGG